MEICTYYLCDVCRGEKVSPNAEDEALPTTGFIPDRYKVNYRVDMQFGRKHSVHVSYLPRTPCFCHTFCCVWWREVARALALASPNI